MSHLPKAFSEKSPDIQKKIVELGLYCWTLIEHQIEEQKDISMADLINIWKDKGRSEGRKQAELELDQELKQKQSQLKSLEIERDQIESRCKKLFDQEKLLLIEKTRMEVEKEFQKIKDDKIRLETKLEAQEDFQLISRSLSLENTILKEQIEKLTKTKSSATIGKDGENEIDILLASLQYEYENTAKDDEKADFRITTETKRNFILDSKKYKRNVGKKEKDKLIRDTDNDATVSGGIMVSLLSGITHQSHGDIIITPNNKPILFISLMGMTVEAQIDTLKISLKLLERYTMLQEEKERADLIEKIKRATITLTDTIQRFKNVEKYAEKIKEDSKIGLSELEFLLGNLRSA